MDAAEFIEPFARLMDELVTPAAVRAVERGGDITSLWASVEDSGYLDALVSEEAGGAGLDMGVVHGLWQILGRHAVPLPIGETMIARALLTAAGQDVPDGPILLATVDGDGRALLSLGRTAQHVLVENGSGLRLCSAASGAPQAMGAGGDLSARFQWPMDDAALFDAPPAGLRAYGAVLRAALIAGAADELVQRTSDYAVQRVQFGKPIGRQQALQQNLAVMAEHAVAARLASQLGCAGGLSLSLVSAATAKSVASRAAALVANTAHAVHGAIGISEEYDLQLLTRRLHEWRLADGSESYWNRILGAQRLASDAVSVDFVRSALPVGGVM